MTLWLRLATAAVRAWTRAYTWRLAPDVRDARRAEIESDLWEHLSAEDSNRTLPLDVVSRLVLGIPDDVHWRVEHMSSHRAHVRHPLVLSVGAAAVLACLWIGMTARQADPAAASRRARPQLATHAGAPATAPSTASSVQSTRDRPAAVLAMHAFVKHALPVALFGLATTSICHAQAARSADVAPRDAVTTIIDAFREHPVVGLNEGHGEERSHAFMLGLIRDPRFPSVYRLEN